MIGAFYQPQAVLIDTNCLTTLSDRDFRCGLAEVVKYGIIYDAEFFTWLEQHTDQLLSRDQATLAFAIQRSCEIKAEVVAQDEREGGIRAILNLGHTFGHAIEGEHSDTWRHGEAVAAGTIIASKLAMAMQLITASDYRRIFALIEALELPTQAPKMPWETWLRFMQRDKKVKAGQLRFVLPTRIGAAQLFDTVDAQQVKAAIADEF